ncbi:TetR/AcrR family transcriptional regulator C-terminal domain-containing protein [Alteribacter natronophilus]|uniref:TetR/AcrR family transcriptional regulator C-terminal domain-containing protein n=1 Tax=Alteribacter natronophilus TaxID=2583810 RepID=UPI00110D2CB4|nr:TetR/AcrR family transcriptional regulator C-terminal domain-containing protein [Alteribacter natronophilus]TMW71452.1 TetR family transcriptional regulator [Alteribacter natronophilus]
MEKQPTRTVSKERVIKTALVLLQEEGFKKLSIRKLADKLDIKGSSLYWHFKNKSELLEWISDEICRQIPLPNPENDWEKELTALALHYRDVLLEIRDAAYVMVESMPSTPNRLKLISTASVLFKQAGLKEEDIFSSAWMFDNYITSFVIEEYRYEKMKESPPEPGTVEEMDLPFDFSIPDTEKEFRFGLEVLIAGFKSKAGEGK